MVKKLDFKKEPSLEYIINFNKIFDNFVGEMNTENFGIWLKSFPNISMINESFKKYFYLFKQKSDFDKGIWLLKSTHFFLSLDTKLNLLKINISENNTDFLVIFSEIENKKNLEYLICNCYHTYQIIWICQNFHRDISFYWENKSETNIEQIIISIHLSDFNSEKQTNAYFYIAIDSLFRKLGIEKRVKLIKESIINMLKIEQDKKTVSYLYYDTFLHILCKNGGINSLNEWPELIFYLNPQAKSNEIILSNFLRDNKSVKINSLSIAYFIECLNKHFLESLLINVLDTYVQKETMIVDDFLKL